MKPCLLHRRALLSVAAACALPGAAVAAPPTFAWPTLTLLDGRRIGPDDWNDVAAVLVIFATWCPFCRRHNEHVEQLHRAAAGPKLRVIGAALDREPEGVRRYMFARGWTFPVSMQGAELRAMLRVREIVPVTVGVDRSGRVGTPIPGEMFAEDVMAFAALAKARTPGSS